MKEKIYSPKEVIMDEYVMSQLQRLTPEQKNYVVTTLPSRQKEKSTAYILWIVFGVYYFYLNKPVKNILLWITSFCFIGVIWWFIDLFRISGMVKDYNREAAKKVIAEALTMYPGRTVDAGNDLGDVTASLRKM